jgi:glutamate synthase domain-containing protein 1
VYLYSTCSVLAVHVRYSTNTRYNRYLAKQCNY